MPLLLRAVKSRYPRSAILAVAELLLYLSGLMGTQTLRGQGRFRQIEWEVPVYFPTFLVSSARRGAISFRRSVR